MKLILNLLNNFIAFQFQTLYISTNMNLISQPSQASQLPSGS
jgi:hypothetical protein